MKITDYETGRSLRDVELSLSMDEAQELAAYLNRLIANPAVSHIHLSELNGHLLERELAVTIRPAKATATRRKSAVQIPIHSVA